MLMSADDDWVLLFKYPIYRKWETIIHLFLVRDKNCSKFSYLVEENEEEKGLHE